MRERPSARLLVINPFKEVLLFKFHHTKDALAGNSYWATPGGGVEEGETFHEAAIRELHEETGILIKEIAAPIAERRFQMRLPNSETVFSVERYFVVHVEQMTVSRSGWTAQELQVMTDHRWWSESDLRATDATVWPDTLIDMLVKGGVFGFPL
jgi:8-oxo-dGTP pyrophosphatase MutT (NUDIX family)